MEMPSSARNFLRKFPEKLPLGDLPFSKKNKAHLFLFCILRCNVVALLMAVMQISGE